MSSPNQQWSMVWAWAKVTGENSKVKSARSTDLPDFILLPARLDLPGSVLLPAKICVYG
jgi:hypothetical protein